MAALAEPQSVKLGQFDASGGRTGMLNMSWNLIRYASLRLLLLGGAFPSNFLCVFSTGSGLQVPANAGARSRKDTKKGVGPT